MAGQPTVEIGAFFLMTFNAKSHFKTSLCKPVDRLHRTVALPTFDRAVDVPLVVKQHVLCDQIDFYPRRGCSGIVIPVFFLYPGMIRDDIFVAMKALSHRRKSGMIGISDIGMTITAFYFFYTGMHLVAEWDGLFGADIHLPVCVEKIHKCSDEKSRAGGPKKILNVFIHRWNPTENRIQLRMRFHCIDFGKNS